MGTISVPYDEFACDYANVILDPNITVERFERFWLNKVGGVDVGVTVMTTDNINPLLVFPPVIEVSPGTFRTLILQSLLRQNMLLNDSLGLFTKIEGNIIPIQPGPEGTVFCKVHLFVNTVFNESLDIGYFCGLTQDGLEISNKVLECRRQNN